MTAQARTFLIEPFDMMHATEEGVTTLQTRFATWLCTLRDPARLICSKLVLLTSIFTDLLIT